MHTLVYHRLGLPVWATDREVLKALRRKLKPSARRGRKSRKNRHALMRGVLKVHHNARNLCREFRL